ncbi:MAG: DUF2330 domain-containing protein [Myxococcota bacterium]
MSLTSREAAACGAVFVPREQTTTVEQTGLNVVYARDGDVVEAHIQIQHRGDEGTELGWVVPVMARPEVSIGSDPLFDRLLEGTVPLFRVRRNEEDNCSRGFSGCGAAGGGDERGDEGESEDPLRVAEGTVGVYDYARLEGGTVQEITQWLDDNGYAYDEQSVPILQEYLAEGFGFLAFKLPRRSRGGEQAIHPVVLRYPGTEVCLPLRMTRIAGSERMSVRVFVLGSSRAVPSNYRHVELNRLKISSDGDDYDREVYAATHEQDTQGRAFVTEFAGSPPPANATVYSELWDSRAFADLDPADLTEVLMGQRLLKCSADEDACTPEHPLLMDLLEAYLPPPWGKSAERFYSCSYCDPQALVGLDWDRAGFVEAMEEFIVGPGEQAADLLALPYLTRMHAVMSPEEMTVDPVFHENPDLPDVSRLYSQTRVENCEGPSRVVLDDGRRIFFDSNPPGFSSMPSSLRIEEIPPQGAPVVLFDHSDAIDEELARWNAEHGPPPQGCDCRAVRWRWRGSGPLLLMFGLGLLARRRRGG